MRPAAAGGWSGDKLASVRRPFDEPDARDVRRQVTFEAAKKASSTQG